MITYDMVKNGYEKGFINLTESPNGDGIVCKIGDNWFYFGGATAEEYKDVELYKNDIPKKNIIKEIYEVLEELSTEFKDEYLYYEGFLRNNLEFEQKENIVSLWGRLGVQIDMTPEEFEVLKRNDKDAKDLLVKLIKSDRCSLSGETYFPPEPNEEYLHDYDEYLEFDIDSQSIHKDAEVDIEAFREELTEIYCFDVSELSDEQIVEKHKDLQDRLAGDDVYTALYTDAVYDVFGIYSGDEIENNPEIKALREEICNLRHELDGALIYDPERAPKIEKCLTVRELELNAALEGVKLNLDPDDIIDVEHLDCLWYDGYIGSMEYKGYTVDVKAVGEVKFSVLDENGEHLADLHNPAHEDILMYIIDDETLHKLVEDGRVVFGLENHVEFVVHDKSDNVIEPPDGRSVLSDNVLEAFADMSVYKEVIDKIELSQGKEEVRSSLEEKMAAAEQAKKDIPLNGMSDKGISR